MFRYPLAVTRHKDSESSSTSLYNQNAPWDPVVCFEDYIRDNENIHNQVRPFHCFSQQVTHTHSRWKGEIKAVVGST